MMGGKTVIEIDHDYLPRAGDEQALLSFAKGIRSALRCKQAEKLPPGVKRVEMSVLPTQKKAQENE